jgi:membrane-associated phospholipid phosphatase
VRVQITAARLALAVSGVASLAQAQAGDKAPAPPATPSPPLPPGHVDAPRVPSGETLPVSNKPVATGLPRRHQGKRLMWDPGFNRMDAPEMVVTGVSIGVALAAAIVPPLQTGWKSGILFDDGARRALRLSSYKARLDARDASDVGLAILTSFPILVDSMIVAYWYRGSDDVALQMALIDAEAIAVSSALQGAATFFSGRERPYGQNCGGELREQSIDCQAPSRYRSFFSGHSSLSFTSAALICAHHQRLDLFESAADPVTCASGLAAATAVATLRVVGDMHYLSDVLTGAVIGTAVGLGIPLLHHYRKEEERTATTVQVQLVPAPNGLQIVGAF